MHVVNNAKSKKTLLIYLILSLLFLMLNAQTSIIERGSLTYWLFLSPLLLLLINVQQLISNIFLRSWPILLMLVLVLVGSLYRGELQVLLRVALLLLMLSWLQSNDATIRIKTLSNLYVAIVLISILLGLFIDNFNQWGIIPDISSHSGGVWRVSFFHDIVNTAFFSLLVFMICTKDMKTCSENKLAIGVALYFIIFSFVRTAIISLTIYLFLSLIFNMVNNKRLLFIFSIIVAVIANLLVAYSLEILQTIQSWPLIDRILLRGEHNLSMQEMYAQLYRPWQWGEQWCIFINSPYLLGEGIYDFNALKSTSIRSGGFESDSESLLIGMLAQYGIAALFFYCFLLFHNYKNASQFDKWACAIFPVIIFISMNYGTIFHPANALFILYFLLLLRGSKAFV